MVPPRVLRALAHPPVGHLDPDFIALMNEVQDPLAELADGYAFHVFTSAWDDVIDDVLGVSRDRP